MGLFDSIQLRKVPGSNFDLSHQHKLSCDIGELIPCMVEEALPGDVWKISTEVLARMAPLIVPPFHNLDVTVHYFFVPNRILWPQWEDWITGKTEVALPTDKLNFNIADTDLGWYLGYRRQDNQEVSMFPVAAYTKIYDEYYRAQHIIAEKGADLISGGANPTYVTHALSKPFHRAWGHDYFTSALPWPQIQDAVELPILQGTEIPVRPDWLGTPPSSTTGNPLARVNSTGALATSIDLQTDASGNITDGTNTLIIDPNSNLVADTDGLVPDINDLREALALQRWLEMEARVGQRYVEVIEAFWGVRSPDSRLQRPEYVHGYKDKMIISEVLTTGASTGDPVGNQAGHGISVGGSKQSTYAVQEHGWIIGILSLLPKTGYYQGLRRHLTRTDRYDYANPMFARLGEQAIYQKEIYLTSSDSQATLDTVFGYIPRFAEYKHVNNQVSGEFASTLEYWHMDRKFTSAPTLNETFIDCVHDKRNFASITGNSTIYALVQNNCYVYRKLPKYGIPSII